MPWTFQPKSSKQIFKGLLETTLTRQKMWSSSRPGRSLAWNEVSFFSPQCQCYIRCMCCSSVLHNVLNCCIFDMVPNIMLCNAVLYYVMLWHAMLCYCYAMLFAHALCCYEVAEQKRAARTPSSPACRNSMQVLMQTIIIMIIT